MKELRLQDYIDHIAEAARQACDYVEGMDEDTFQSDERTQAAVLMKVIVIGEATSKILQSHLVFVSKHPEVPWGQMRWMRNRIAHGYFDINFHVVWSAIQIDLPPLRLSLASIQREDFDSADDPGPSG